MRAPPARARSARERIRARVLPRDLRQSDATRDATRRATSSPVSFSKYKGSVVLVQNVATL